jgi:hypothetical protein
VRDYIPCIRDADSEPGLFDLVSRQFYPNSNNKGKFKYEKTDNIYSKIEYIKLSTAAQYFNTYYWHSTAKTCFEFDCSIDELTAYYYTLFGARTRHDASDAYYLGVSTDTGVAQ